VTNGSTTGTLGGFLGGLFGGSLRSPAPALATRPAVQEVIPAVVDPALRPGLPPVLLPLSDRADQDEKTAGLIVPRLGPVQGSPAVLQELTRPLPAVAAAPPDAVRACRAMIQAAAAPYRAKQVEAVGAGPATRTSRGITTVPIDARVVYARGRVSQVKQARISCRLNTQGIVVALR
jgi:hypothetical protein